MLVVARLLNVDALQRAQRWRRAAVVMIQQFWLPGLKAFNEHGAPIAVVRDEASRLASYMVPAGDHTIVVERTPTTQEHAGKLISLMALVLLALLLGFLIRRRRASR